MPRVRSIATPCLGALSLLLAASATAEIDERCNGEFPFTMLQHFVDGGELCDAEGETHGGGSGADGVDAMDFDGDCDLDIITGWEESGQVLIYLNPTLKERPAQGCAEPFRFYPDNTEARTTAIREAWPILEVKREAGAQPFFGATEDAVFGDNDGDRVADFVVIASEKNTREVFVSFPTCHDIVSVFPTLVLERLACTPEVFHQAATTAGDLAVIWHTFKLQDGDQFFMRANVGDVDLDGRPDILAGSKANAINDSEGRDGSIRWWKGPPAAAWRPQLWKMGAALPDYGGESEANFFMDLWGGRHRIAKEGIDFVMEMKLMNLVVGNNPGSSKDYPEVVFSDRTQVGYAYLVNPSDPTNEASWLTVPIDDPGSGSPFRWAWIGQLVPGGAPEIVATYNANENGGVFARWYEVTGQASFTIPFTSVTLTLPTWQRYEVVLDGQDLPWGADTSVDDDSTPGTEGTSINKSIGILDVEGDGVPELIAGIRGRAYHGTFLLKPESGGGPPRCDQTRGDPCDEDTEEWMPVPISPYFPGNLKFDNFALVDADLDCDVDVFTVEENGVGDKGLGVVWYENLRAQGTANQAACSAPLLNEPPILTGDTTQISADEGGGELVRSGTWSDPDGDPVALQATGPGTLKELFDGTWSWKLTPTDGPLNGTLRLNADDGRGGVSSLEFDVSVRNVRPTIDDVAHDGPVPEGGSAEITVSAHDPAGVLDPLAYEFDCGDGFETAVGNQASCLFEDDGTHTVDVRVGDGDGGVATSSVGVPVENVPPKVNSFTNSGPIDEGKTVTVTVDAEAGPFDALRYEFDCFASVPFPLPPTQTPSPTTTCTFPDDGSFEVGVRVLDEDESAVSATTRVTVRDVLPTISSVTNSGPIPEGGSAQITVQAKAGSADVLTYAFDCNNDGSYEISGTAKSATCSYANDGSFPVPVRVRDGDGNQTTDSTTVVVTNVLPAVTITGVSPIEPDVGELVVISADFVDPADDGDYGCRVVPELGASPVSGNVSGTTCTSNAFAYATPGPRTATVFVTEATGPEGQATVGVTVVNRPPEVGAVALDPSPSLEGAGVTASATFTDDGSAGSYTCTIDWGEGDEPETASVSGSSCQAASPHVYDDDEGGPYTVTVAVADPFEGVGTNAATQTVRNVAPTATFAVAPAEIYVGEGATAAFSGATDPSAADTAAGFTYEFDCDDDGTLEATQTADSFACAYGTAGIYTVAGAIRDKDGDASTTTLANAVTVLSPAEAATDLIDDVIALLDAGVLNAGQANGLIGKLEDAIADLEAGQTKKALKKLAAFVSSVASMALPDENTGEPAVLSAGQADALLDKAARVIAAAEA